MGRRRRKVVQVVRRKLPELYLCPKCGKNTVKVTINKKKGRVAVICSDCGLSSSYSLDTNMAEVDAYCLFVDAFYGGDAPEETVIE